MTTALLSITEFIGRFHPVLVHLPIGILMIGLLLQWLSGREKYKISIGVIKVILLCGMYAAILSCITGYLLSLSGDYDASLVALHRWMGIAVVAVSMILVVKVIRQQFDVIHKIVSFSLLGLVIVTGHLGGSLTHGSDYLTAALKNNNNATDQAQKAISNIQEAKVYVDVVQPMLQSKCYSCHGPQKQKGGLRLDDPEWIMKGGKNGPPVMVGKGDQSELIKRLLLPWEDEHHMPPKEKQQLTERQIALLHWWIEAGADFTRKIKDLSQPAKIKPVLLAMQGNSSTVKKNTNNVPSVPVEAADPKAIEALSNKGVVVMRVAQNSNYLMANFVTAVNTGDSDMLLLLPLKKQLIWLKLGGTEIVDEALATISQCKNLRELQLTNTHITDKGLTFVKSLDSLQTLNLVGTKVSAIGIGQLQSLKKLQSLYLYKTNVGKTDWPQLKSEFPKTYLDSGGYTLAFIHSDTMLVQTPKKIN
jgi:mono/diheme cytochrome c family protein